MHIYEKKEIFYKKRITLQNYTYNSIIIDL